MNTKTMLLDSIDNIDTVTQECVDNTLEILANSYVKALQIIEEYDGTDLGAFSIFQEGEILDKATGKGKDEGVLKKVASFVPRLIMAIVDAIKSALNKNKARKAEIKLMNDIELSDKEIKALKEEKEKSPIYKAILGVGCACAVTAAGMMVISIRDYSDAVEFKDDVNFQIATDGSTMKVVFPYYRIDQVKEFNKELTKMFVVRRGRNVDIPPEKLKELFNILVINQSRVSERDFTFESWDTFSKEVIGLYETLSKNLDHLSSHLLENNENLNNIDSGTVNELNRLIKKTPKDIELITKLDEKIRSVYQILKNPDASKREKRKAAKFTFTPVPVEKMINIYNFDTSELQKAIQLLNKFYQDNCEYGTVPKNLNQKASISSDYNTAMEHIRTQFNASITFNFTDGGGSTPTAEGSKGITDIKMSKTKGFDLGHASLVINNDPYFVATQVKKNNKPVFGQMLCGIICHEIFHNIARQIYLYKSKIETAMNDMLFMAWEVFENIKQLILRMLESYTNNVSSAIGKTVTPDQEAKDKTVKRFLYLFANAKDKNKIKEFSDKVFNDNDDDLLNAIDEKEIVQQIDVKDRGSSTLESLAAFANFYGPIIGGCICMIIYRYNFMVGGLTAISTLFISVYQATQVKMEGTNEETMCDMCAAMYKLPVYLNDVKPLIADGKKRRGQNRGFGKHDVHSTTYARQSVSYGLAKEMLNSGENLDQETKDYLEFIIAQNEGIDKTEQHFTKKQMKKSAPAFTENINRAVSNFMHDHNIPVEEYAVIEEDDDDDIITEQNSWYHKFD